MKASNKAIPFVLLNCLCCFAMSQEQQEEIWKKARGFRCDVSVTLTLIQ